MDLDQIDRMMGVQLGSREWVEWWGDEEPVWVRRWRGSPVLKAVLCFVNGPVSGHLRDDTLRSIFVDLARFEGSAFGVARAMTPAAVRARHGEPASALPGLPSLRSRASDNWDLGERRSLRVEYDDAGAIEVSVGLRDAPAASAKRPAKAKRAAKKTRAKKASSGVCSSPVSSIRPQSLIQGFRDHLARQELDPSALSPRQGVEQMLRYYDEVSVEGRPRGMQDMLLYEQSVKRGALSSHVVRQLYARGRGIQLDLGWTAKRCDALPSFGLWSKDEPAWRERVAQALDALEAAAGQAQFEVTLRLERF